jgi:glycosyltransferase involved in cell wall biosynthesis
VGAPIFLEGHAPGISIEQSCRVLPSLSQAGMKILWVKTDFLHPTTRGGQIRTLEMLRRLHRRHEIHYVGFEDALNPEGMRRSSEYSTRSYPVPHQPVSKHSIRFAGQLAGGLVSRLPVAGMRFRSAAMRATIADLISSQQFDAKVCDFLFPSASIEDMRGWVLFQHNVETTIWERHAQAGRTPLHRAYFRMQARKMFAWERAVCRAVSHVVAVSEVDERTMRERFEIDRISSIPTGVDLEYFARPWEAPHVYDLVFVGSMDWMPNIDGITWFLAEVLPLIYAKKPDCRIAIVGRTPPRSLVAEGRNPLVTVTGTVPDVRPYLWQSAVSIVPLRVGGGTRLKIFEAVAAGTPVISTTIGAEGLPLRHGETVRIADSPTAFAAECIDLLDNEYARNAIAEQALDLVRERFSWEQVAHQFEDTLRHCAVHTPQTA